MEHASNGHSNCTWSSWYSPQRFIKGTGGHVNNWTRGHYPNHCFIEIGQNIKKRPGDLRRLAVTQTPVKDHQLTLV